MHGNDPNWGRIVSAAGYAGVAFAESDLSLWLGPYLLYECGRPLPFDAAAVSRFIKDHREVTARLVFTLGRARGASPYLDDYSVAYVIHFPGQSAPADFTSNEAEMVVAGAPGKMEFKWNLLHPEKDKKG